METQTDYARVVGELLLSIDYLLCDPHLVPIERMRLEDMRLRWWRQAADRGIAIPVASMMRDRTGRVS